MNLAARVQAGVHRPVIGLIAALALLATALTAVGRAEDVPLSGRVVEVFGDRAIVESEGRRYLVGPLVAGEGFPAGVGELVQIVGPRQGNVIVPQRLVLASGAVVNATPATDGASPLRGLRSIDAQLKRYGVVATERPYRRRNQTVVAGQTGDGRRVIATFDHSLRIEEIEDADHRHIHPNAPEALTPQAVMQRLEKQGYGSIRLLDQSRYRLLFAATGPAGERMELHVDRGGSIFKRVWLR
ncbi:MAG: hypothetical protein IT536_08585 [Hyphomicrobiales bacterium]|nr:hypothetical protein [Hyphomicrobiales bacterium]